MFCSGLARRVQAGPLRQAGHAQGEQEEGEGEAPTLRQGKFFSSRFQSANEYIMVKSIFRVFQCVQLYTEGYPCLRPDRQAAYSGSEEEVLVQCSYFVQLPTTKISHLIAIIITLKDLHQARCRQRTEPRLHVERPDALFAGGAVGQLSQIHVRVQRSHQVRAILIFKNF